MYVSKGEVNLKLLLITHDFPFGNAETFLETEIKYATQAFKKVYIISASKNKAKTRNVPEGVIVYKVGREYKKAKCIIKSICRIFSNELFQEIKIKSKHYSIITIIKQCLIFYIIEERLRQFVLNNELYGDDYIAYSYWLAEGSYFISKNRSLWHKSISRVHSYEVWKETYIPFICNTIVNLDKVFAISLDTKKMMINMLSSYGISKKYNCTLSRLGVLVSKSEVHKKQSKNYISIVSCSNIYKLKRLDLIIDIISELSNFTFVEWVHFGGGIDECEIKKYAQRSLSSKSVKWSITGWIDNEKVIEYYKKNQVDLFINMSDKEGIPVSIMEAISFGIPCLARDVGGIREIVINEESGYLVKQDVRVEECIHKICQYIKKDIKYKNNIYKKVKNIYEKYYDAEINYRTFYKIIFNL